MTSQVDVLKKRRHEQFQINKGLYMNIITNILVATTFFISAVAYAQDNSSRAQCGLPVTLDCTPKQECSRARDTRETMRDGGHAPYAAYYENQIPKARALVARLRGR